MPRKNPTTKGGKNPVQRKIKNTRVNAKVKKRTNQPNVVVSRKKKGRSFNNYGS